MRSAPDLLLLHLFFFFFFLTWLSQTALLFRWSLDMTRSTTELLESYRSGLRRPVSSSDRCWVWLSKRLNFLACPYSPYVDIWTPSNLVFALVIQNTNFVTPGWAVRRMIAKYASTRPSPLWGAPRTVLKLRASSPAFFWRYTTPPCQTKDELGSCLNFFPWGPNHRHLWVVCNYLFTLDNTLNRAGPAISCEKCNP